ncbi:MAG: exodeoxyribonuclease V subunit gamma [Sandaracinaceae bacterium]|nr:exodeoxyribonuclease V subunit gamma [Sandaracinaceae bacterium]
MIHLVYSNRTEELLGALSARVAEVRGQTSLYSALHIVVPNPNVEAYLKQGLAESLGIAANLRTCFLATLVRDLLRDAAPDVRVIDRRLLEGQVLAVLLDAQAMSHPELEAARAWLSASGESRGAMDERRFQLAMQLARLFDEYAGARPEMLDAWATRLTFEEKTAREVELWQRRVWLQVMERLRAREIDEGVRYRLLRDVFRGLAPTKLNVPAHLFVFGFSYFPRAYHVFFETIARACDVHIYTLNPCREFWEDSGKDEAPDMPLLRQWGRPGRDHVAALNKLADFQWDDRFAAPRAESLLAHVQSDVLERATEHPAPTQPLVDASITITTCPSMQREAEHVAAQIWAAVADSESGGRPLRFHEIGVFINPAERDAYLSHLSTAFRDNHMIPHHVVDLPLAMESRLVEGVELLLALPNGRFGRAEMLRVLTHPACAARYSDANVSRWVETVDALSIMHGADRSDHAGSYIESDSFNWDQGIKRIALGAFMNSDGDAPYIDGENAYSPLELSESDRANAALLGTAVRALVADVRHAMGAALTIQEWAVFLRNFVKSHLGARDESDERDLTVCLRAIDELAEIDVDGTRVSFRIAYGFAMGKLAGLGARRGPFLEGGVVVSSFFPMRAIPFRVVFALGLGEGKFPAPAIVNPLDLRTFHRIAGDVTQREQDKYLFLETLLCARDTIALSFVARDELTGDAREPSIVVRDLFAYLQARYSLSQAMPEPEPLRRYDARNVELPSRILPDEARREAFVAKLANEVRVSWNGPITIEQVREQLDEAARQRLDATLGIHARERQVMPTRDRIRVSISALRQFLECQVQGYAKFHFGDREDESEEDIATLENEPFAHKLMHKAPFLRRVWTDAHAADVEPKAVLAQQVARLTRLGEWPVGVFGRAELARAEEALSLWTQNLALEGLSAPPFRSHYVGPVDEQDRESTNHPSLLLSLPDNAGQAAREVEIVGRINATDQSTATYLHLIATTSTKPDIDRYKREAALRLTLESALYAAATNTTSDALYFAPVIASRATTKSHFSRVTGWAPDDARAWLSTLVLDLLGAAPRHLLPHEVVFKWASKPDSLSLSDSIHDLVDDYEAGSRNAQHASFARGPVRRLDELPMVDEASLRALVARRFQPVLSRRLGEK